MAYAAGWGWFRSYDDHTGTSPPSPPHPLHSVQVPETQQNVEIKRTVICF